MYIYIYIFVYCMFLFCHFLTCIYRCWREQGWSSILCGVVLCVLVLWLWEFQKKIDACAGHGFECSRHWGCQCWRLASVWRASIHWSHWSALPTRWAGARTFTHTYASTCAHTNQPHPNTLANKYINQHTLTCTHTHTHRSMQRGASKSTLLPLPLSRTQ